MISPVYPQYLHTTLYTQQDGGTHLNNWQALAKLIYSKNKNCRTVELPSTENIRHRVHTRNTSWCFSSDKYVCLELSIFIYIYLKIRYQFWIPSIDSLDAWSQPPRLDHRHQRYWLGLKMVPSAHCRVLFFSSDGTLELLTTLSIKSLPVMSD